MSANMAATPARLCWACRQPLYPLMTTWRASRAKSPPQLNPSRGKQSQRVVAFRGGKGQASGRGPIPAAHGKDDRTFADFDVPGLEFWQRGLAIYKTHLTAEECMGAAKEYCSIALGRSTAWKGTLEREHNLPASTLYVAAIILLRGAPSANWSLGLHMLGTASDLGYAQSTLTIVRLATLAKPGSTNSTMFRNAETRFKDLVRRGRDPDALTLQGVTVARAGDSELALRWLDEAVEAGRKTAAPALSPEPDSESPKRDSESATEDAKDDTPVDYASPAPTEARPFRWSWELTCHIERGRALLRLGRRAEAEAAFRTAAHELDSPKGYLELAKILPANAPERRAYLLRAAVSAEREACGLLGELEQEDAALAAEATRKADASLHSLMAEEWFRLDEGRRGTLS